MGRCTSSSLHLKKTDDKDANERNKIAGDAR